MSDRTSSLGLLSFGNEFAGAAALLRKADRLYVNPPLFYLYAHAIELQLKAFLRSKGYTLAQLKRLGHNLKAVLSACQQQGLESFVRLTRAQVAAIGQVNLYYSAKQLEYIVTGSKQFPKPELLSGVCEALYSGLAASCYQHMQSQRT